LGPGLLESTYEVCLAKELEKRKLSFERQKTLPVYYDGDKVDLGFRMDILVERRIVIEVKAVEEFHDVHVAQLLTYLKFAELRLGFLINFNTTRFTHGIRRIVNGFEF
jgi:GxxExxY protein